MPKEADLSWAAGLFEGEGTITLIRVKSQKNDYLTESKITVGNTDYQIVGFFQQHWGGWISTKGKKKGRKQHFEWAITGNQTWIVLTDLLAYFRTDRVREKARLLIEVEEFRKRSPRFGEESKQTQTKLWEHLQRIRALNKRGDAELPHPPHVKFY